MCAVNVDRKFNGENIVFLFSFIQKKKTIISYTEIDKLIDFGPIQTQPQLSNNNVNQNAQNAAQANATTDQTNNSNTGCLDCCVCCAACCVECCDNIWTWL